VSLVLRDKITCHWVKGVPANEGMKQGHPLKKALFNHYWFIQCENGCR